MSHQEVPAVSGGDKTNGVGVGTAVSCTKATSVVTTVGELVGVEVLVGRWVGVAVGGLAVAVLVGPAVVAVAIDVAVTVIVDEMTIGVREVPSGVGLDNDGTATGSGAATVPSSTRNNGGPPI
jgi:hypothetical protein